MANCINESFLLVHTLLSCDLPRVRPRVVWACLCMSNLIVTMAVNSGASTSSRNSSDVSSSEVAERATAFDGWKYKHYFVLLSEEDAKSLLHFVCWK